MREIPDPGFAGDAGSTPADVAAALAAGDRAAALAAVSTSRLLVPVVAVLGEVEVDDAGLAHDKSSDMAVVLVRGADGRDALLAFTGTATMAAWDPQARPVPVAARTAALAAVQERAAAVVVDIAGPVTLVIEDADLLALAGGEDSSSSGMFD